SRHLKISTPPRHHHHIKQTQQGKLFNPNTDPIPMRRTTEPESISDATSSSSPPRNTPTSHQRDPPASRQLFNHRKDDPVRFAVLTRPSSTGGRPPPTPKSSGDYVSTSSTSSYAHSLTSSFTGPTQGSGVNKLRDALGVKVDFSDEADEKEKEAGKKKKKAVHQKSKVKVERIADETSEVLKIPNQYHTQLIGQNGRTFVLGVMAQRQLSRKPSSTFQPHEREIVGTTYTWSNPSSEFNQSKASLIMPSHSQIQAHVVQATISIPLNSLLIFRRPLLMSRPPTPPIVTTFSQPSPSTQPYHSHTFGVSHPTPQPPFRISMIFSIPLSHYRVLLHLLTSGLNPTILANLLRHFDGRSNTYTISAPLCACACGVHCNFFSFAAATQCIIKPRHQIAHIILRTHWNWLELQAMANLAKPSPRLPRLEARAAATLAVALLYASKWSTAAIRASGLRMLGPRLGRGPLDVTIPKSTSGHETPETREGEVHVTELKILEELAQYLHHPVR
ncbi:hypothetical protein DFJ58DRAFT_890873, partial [Suillus subalutaceus]|uniref:uncharacterized protein n=1 Tax=Suillus subalutaceus TaxID=48586 RepID=UPI001B8605FE